MAPITRSMIFASWILLLLLKEVASAEDESPADECKMYMAPSTLPGAGWGLYTAEDLPEGSSVGSDYADLYVPIQDRFKTLPYRGQQHFLSWLGYIWPERINAFWHTYNEDVFPEIPMARYGFDEGLNAASTFQFTDGTDIVSAFSPGVASLVNSHPYFANLIKNDEAERVDVTALTQKHPAFSPYHGVTFETTDFLPAGTELLINYGAEWHDRYYDKMTSGLDYYGDGDEHHFQYLPDEKAKRVSDLANKRDSHEILDKLQQIHNASLDEDGNWIASTNSDLSAQQKTVERNAKDDVADKDDSEDDEVSDNDAEEFLGNPDYMFDHHEYPYDPDYDEVDYPAQEMDWLKEHGMCVDNLKGGTSQIPGAGRGAFAQRSISKGQVIAPAPLLAIKRADLDILEATRKEGQYRSFLNHDKVVGQEMILNYCFGHKDSPLLLLPYTPVVNFINHNGQEPNAMIRWPQVNNEVTSMLRDPEEWLSQHPLDVLNESGQLMMEFVALRDIAPDEEIVINYGSAWEEAYQQAYGDGGPFRHEIRVPEGFYPDAWLHKKAVYEVAPFDLAPGEVVQLKWAHNGKAISDSAHAVGLPSDFTSKVKAFTDERGVTDMYKKLLLADSPVLGDNQWFLWNDTKKQEWFAYGYKQREWAFNMHYIAAWDESARRSLLGAMGEAGFDVALNSIGKHLGLNHITCFQASYMGASRCENSVTHSDIFNTDGKSFNVIFPVILVEDSPPELDIISSDANIVLPVNYIENVAYFLTDYGGYHKTSPHKFEGAEEIRIMVGSYCAEIDETNWRRVKHLYDMEVVPPFMDQFDLPLKEVHWSKDGGQSLLDVPKATL